MIAAEQEYDYYAETLVKIMEDNNLIHPAEKRSFVRYVRGC